MSQALDAVLPQVAKRLPRCTLGEWPTPVEPLALGRPDLYVKREDLSSPLYGGNKVRCLEPVLGALRAEGETRIWSTGAWGSNQALATAVHGRRFGFEVGAALFKQPASVSAAKNLRASALANDHLLCLRSVLAFPLLHFRLRNRGTVIPPGAASPRGALGHLSAALEIAQAVVDQQIPEPQHIVLPVGSTCTTAGLCVGFALAHTLGLIKALPQIHAVRVTPWPVTSRFRIGWLARKAAHLLATLEGPTLSKASLLGGLHSVGGSLGRGYGHATAGGADAQARFAQCGGPQLDSTYAAKGAAGLLKMLPKLDGPVVFWSTKSKAMPMMAEIHQLPKHTQKWALAAT